MEIFSILIIPILGAVIGYSTNLLAITMLFRPHGVKHIFGMRIPFTPGLIPKERHQLARKIGETLKANVLTREILIEAAANSQIVENIVGVADRALEDFAANPKALGEICAQAFGRGEGELKETVADGIARVFALLPDVPAKSIRFLLGEGFRLGAVSALANLFENVANSGKKLGDILPGEAVKNVVRSNMHHIGPAARRLLADPRANTRLRELTARIVKENAGGFMGIFVKPDKIYNSIADGLLEYLESEENQALLADKFAAVVDDFMARDAAWLAEKIKREQLNGWLEHLILTAQESMSREQADKFIALVREHTKKWGTHLAKKAADALLGLTPAKIFAHIEYKQPMAAAMGRLINILVEKAGEHIVGALDIAKIVEDKMNRFESKEAEGLVLSVVGKQLRWIALLGGILGFIIGFLPMIVNHAMRG